MPLNEGYDPNEGVVVLRQHLQEILAALSWAHSHFSALDLADAYRQGRQAPAPSKITTLLARAYNHAEGYVYDGDPSIQPELILPPRS
jgi:hypothetical protein